MEMMFSASSQWRKVSWLTCSSSSCSTDEELESYREVREVDAGHYLAKEGRCVDKEDNTRIERMHGRDSSPPEWQAD